MIYSLVKAFHIGIGNIYPVQSYLFYQFPIILGLLTSLSDYIFNKLDKGITLDIQSVLLGNRKMDYLVNLLIVLLKKDIFKSREKT